MGSCSGARRLRAAGSAAAAAGGSRGARAPADRGQGQHLAGRAAADGGVVLELQHAGQHCGGHGVRAGVCRAQRGLAGVGRGGRLRREGQWPCTRAALALGCRASPQRLPRPRAVLTRGVLGGHPADAQAGPAHRLAGASQADGARQAVNRCGQAARRIQLQAAVHLVAAAEPRDASAHRWASVRATGCVRCVEAGRASRRRRAAGGRGGRAAGTRARSCCTHPRAPRAPRAPEQVGARGLAQRAQRSPVARAEVRARGVVRRVDNHQAGAGRDQALGIGQGEPQRAAGQRAQRPRLDAAAQAGRYFVQRLAAVLSGWGGSERVKARRNVAALGSQVRWAGKATAAAMAARPPSHARTHAPAHPPTHPPTW